MGTSSLNSWTSCLVTGPLGILAQLRRCREYSSLWKSGDLGTHLNLISLLTQSPLQQLDGIGYHTPSSHSNLSRNEELITPEAGHVLTV